MPDQLKKSASVRRRWVKLLALSVLAGLVTAVVSIPWFYGTPRYWNDFTGRNIDEVIAEFGPSPIPAMAMGNGVGPTIRAIHAWPTGLGGNLLLGVDAEGQIVKQMRAREWPPAAPSHDDEL